MKKGIKFTAAAAMAISALTPVAVFANEVETPVVENGLYTVGQYLSVAQFQALSKAEKKAFLVETMTAGKLAYVLDGKVYDLGSEEVQNAPATELEKFALDFDEYSDKYDGIQFGKDGLVEVAPIEGLVVESVSAINGTTIAAGTPTDLKFLVNGKEELTKAQFEEKYEGYTVSFKYNKSGLSADGKVNVVAGTFKYAVQVTDAEGNLVPAELTPADYVEVKAVAADKAVAVNEIGLVDDDGKAWTQSVLDGLVTIAPTKYVNALGQNQDAKNASDEAIVTAPTIKSVKSSDVTVAYWDATNEVIKVLNDGTVTFTVEFDGIVAKSTITVDVKAEQEIGSVVTKDAKVAAGSNATVEFDVLDQDGERYLGSDALYYTIKQAEGDDVQGTVSTSAGKASITKAFVKGDNTITIFADSDRKEKLGTIKVTAVDVTNALPDAYTLKFANEKVNSLDLNTDKEATSLTLDVKAFIDGIEVPANKGLSEDYKLVAKSGNKNVPVTVGEISEGKLTVSLPETGAKSGTATVDLYTEEGDLLTKVATISVEVKNTTPKFTALTLKKDTKVDATAENLKAAVINAVVEGELEEGALEAKHIASVTPVKDNGVVIVKIDNLYGGALITLEATFEKAETPEVTDPEVTDPEVTDPEVTDPEVTDPEVTDPEVTDPEVTDPEVTDPEVTDPEVTDPEVTDPEVTDPEVTDPEVTDPEVTDPEVTDPEVTDPEVTDPEVTDPEVTDPEVTDPATITVDNTTLQITASETNATVTYDVEGTSTTADVTVSADATSLVITFADGFDVAVLGDSFTIEIDGESYTATYTAGEEDAEGTWTLTLTP